VKVVSGGYKGGLFCKKGSDVNAHAQDDRLLLVVVVGVGYISVIVGKNRLLCVYIRDGWKENRLLVVGISVIECFMMIVA
jgi:hypothetical protein